MLACLLACWSLFLPPRSRVDELDHLLDGGAAHGAARHGRAAGLAHGLVATRLEAGLLVAVHAHDAELALFVLLENGLSLDVLFSLHPVHRSVRLIREKEEGESERGERRMERRMERRKGRREEKKWGDERREK